MNYHYMGGNQAALQARAKEGLAQAEGSLEGAASSAGMAREAKAKVEGGARDLAAQAKVQADKVMR